MADTTDFNSIKGVSGAGRPRKYSDEERIEARRRSQREYYERNKQTKIAYQTHYYADNRERCQEYGRQYYHNNKLVV